MKKLPLSVLIIARNEEGLIGRAVASAGFAEEVVVVDAKSADRTAEIARSLGARVEERAWTGFSDQRNFSLEQARNDWVLVLDADESVTPALAHWLEEFFSGSSHPREPGGWRIKRAEYFLGRRILGACWNPSYQDRLFRRSQARYVGHIHEYPEVEGGWRNAPEEALLDHNPHVTVESFLEKMNRYTTVEAHDRFRSGQRTSIPHLAAVFFANWWKNFFYYKAYRDGAHGFVISLMEAVSRTVRHLKLWQIEEMHRQGRVDLLPDPQRSLTAGAALHRKLEAGEAPRG
ncbi:MAG: glycosyltransferase family 2 protein [Bdellovibrionales bacterium]|nr:glycosyltransferase family 2 protein [Bdellovibrionales bacterium]